MLGFPWPPSSCSRNRGGNGASAIRNHDMRNRVERGRRQYDTGVDTGVHENHRQTLVKSSAMGCASDSHHPSTPPKPTVKSSQSEYRPTNWDRRPRDWGSSDPNPDAAVSGRYIPTCYGFRDPAYVCDCRQFKRSASQPEKRGDSAFSTGS